MSRCRACRAPLPTPGGRGGRPRRHCPSCAPLARAARLRRRRRARDLHRVESLSPAEWALFHVTGDVAARIARDGLVVADEGVEGAGAEEEA